VQEQDWTILRASNEKKFSVHIALVNGVFFQDRQHSRTVSKALKKHLDEIAETDEEFRNWYIAEENGKYTIDWSVFNAGARNMRMIGSVKNSKDYKNGAHFTEMRPLLPANYNRNWRDYLCTAVERREHAFVPSEEMTKNFGATTLAMRKGGGNGGGVEIFRRTQLDAGLRTKCELLKAQMETEKDGVHAARIEQMEQVARNMCIRMAQMLHPGNAPRVVSVEKHEIFAVCCGSFLFGPDGQSVMRVGKNGERKRQRLCFWSFYEGSGICESGTNEARVSVLADLSVSYLCYRCLCCGVIAKSPCRPSFVKPGRFNLEPPEQLRTALGFDMVDYTTDDSTDFYMRPIKPLSNGKVYNENVRRTIVLHAGMGVGKTVTTQRYLETLREENPGISILSLTFRKMLAKSNAEVFNLFFYKDISERKLSDQKELALQLDSVFRLAEEAEDGGLRVRAFDVLILDESESILNHFSSDTMRGSMQRNFLFFQTLVARSNTVIAADADFGTRSMVLLQGTRLDSFVEYHRNPFVVDTEFVEYRSHKKWTDNLMSLVFLQNKRVFVVSNVKKELKRIESEIVHRATRLDKFADGGYDENFVKLVSADTPEAEIVRMAENCNDSWKRHNVLLISPKVGAGISFTEEHYDEAFMYGLPSSAPPRELNQLLGRVRKLRDRKVHIMISENERRVRARTGANMAKSNERQKDLINQYVFAHEEIEADGQRTLRFLQQNDNPLLRQIITLNDEEQVRGINNFREDLIGVLQATNPDVRYRFDLTKNERMEAGFELQAIRAQNHIDDLERDVVATQDVEEDIEEIVLSNQRGRDFFAEAGKNEQVVSIIRKNELFDLLKIQPDCPVAVFEAYLRIIGNGADNLKKIETFAKLFFGDGDSLLLVQQDDLVPVGVDDMEIPTSFALSVNSMDAMLFADIERFFAFYGLDPSTRHTALEFHSSLRTLVDEDSQNWLREHMPVLAEQIKSFPRTLDEEKEVAGVMCCVDTRRLQSIIDFVTDKLYHVGKTTKARDCAEHADCSVFCPVPLRLSFMQALGARYLATQPRASTLGKIFGGMQRVFLMPFMQEYEDFLGAQERVAEEDFLAFATDVTIEKNVLSERLQQARNSRKRKKETTQDPFMEFVNNWTEEDLCDTLLEEFSVDKFLTHFLSLSYKIRTKKEMASAALAMEKCRARFFES